MTLEFDHLVLAVPDLAAGAEMIRQTIGLDAEAGGHHPGHGTANAIAALGDAYLELVTVVDRDEAARSPFGQAVSQGLESGRTLLAVCLRTPNLDPIARRAGTVPVEMHRVRPDGVTLRWRLAGFEQALTSGLPFFIEWAVPAHLQPSYREPAIGTIDWVAIPAPEADIRAWVGSTRLDLRPGSDRLQAGLQVGELSITL